MAEAFQATTPNGAISPSFCRESGEGERRVSRGKARGKEKKESAL